MLERQFVSMYTVQNFFIVMKAGQARVFPRRFFKFLFISDILLLLSCFLGPSTCSDYSLLRFLRTSRTFSSSSCSCSIDISLITLSHSIPSAFSTSSTMLTISSLLSAAFSSSVSQSLLTNLKYASSLIWVQPATTTHSISISSLCRRTVNLCFISPILFQKLIPHSSRLYCPSDYFFVIFCKHLSI
jgi:hypothetical protein